MFDLPQPQVTAAMSPAIAHGLLNAWRSLVVAEGERRLRLAGWRDYSLQLLVARLDEQLCAQIVDALDDHRTQSLDDVLAAVSVR